jgi:hypothetical protein
MTAMMVIESGPNAGRKLRDRLPNGLQLIRFIRHGDHQCMQQGSNTGAEMDGREPMGKYRWDP